MSAIRLALNVGSIVLVAVLGWLLVRIGLGVAKPESLYAPDPIVVPVAVTGSGGGQSASYNFSSDPFSFGEIKVDVAVLVEDVPETTLDLKLIGIVSESNATFRLPSGKNKAVKLDQEVMNGVTLMHTAKSFVTLDVNGESQKLTLERVKLGEKSNSQIISRAASKQAVPSRENVEDFFSKLQLTPSIDRKTGRRKGFKINAAAGANLSQFKLRSGDILTRVGPVLLDTKTPNLLELRELVTSGAAQDFEVIRDGAPVTIRIGQ